MEAGDVLQLVGQFGFAGVLMAYLFWRERNDRDDRKQREERQATRDRDDMEERKALASSLATLAAVISASNGKPRV